MGSLTGDTVSLIPIAWCQTEAGWKSTDPSISCSGTGGGLSEGVYSCGFYDITGFSQIHPTVPWSEIETAFPSGSGIAAGGFSCLHDPQTRFISPSSFSDYGIIVPYSETHPLTFPT